MIIVKGKARFADGEIDRLRPALSAFVEETRASDGCESYHYAIDMIDPDLMHTIESWRDMASKDRHMANLGSLLVALEAAQMECLKVDAYDATFVETVLGDEAQVTGGAQVG